MQHALKWCLILSASLTANTAAAATDTSEDFCGTGKPHAIDATISARFDQAEREDRILTTAEMRDLQGEAYAGWDKELNRVYGELLKGLDAGSAVKLKAAQRAWLKYRDSEIEWLWSKAMYADTGTSGPLNVSGASTEMVRQRVCDLTEGLRTRELHGD